MTRAVANRYVTALADVVMQPKTGLSPEAALEQLEAFGSLLAESGDLAAVLQSPAVLPGEKRDLVAEIGARIGLARVVRNFVHVVTEHRRIAHFDLLVEGFRSWLDSHRDRVQVEVCSAVRLADGQKAALEQRFRDLTGKQVRASYVLDPELLGGSLVRVGSTLYDGSLRAALGTLATGLGTER